jgi:hypothetical protein
MSRTVGYVPERGRVRAGSSAPAVPGAREWVRVERAEGLGLPVRTGAVPKRAAPRDGAGGQGRRLGQAFGRGLLERLGHGVVLDPAAASPLG